MRTALVPTAAPPTVRDRFVEGLFTAAELGAAGHSMLEVALALIDAGWPVREVSSRAHASVGAAGLHAHSPDSALGGTEHQGTRRTRRRSAEHVPSIPAEWRRMQVINSARSAGP